MAIQKGASWIATALGHESPIVKGLRPCYEHALLFMTLGRGISWSINGVPCRIDPRQRHRMARRYDEPVARWLSSHVKPGDFFSIPAGKATTWHVTPPFKETWFFAD